MIMYESRPSFEEAWASTGFKIMMGGMGDDTVMMIAEMYERGYEPDEIVFCDTGSEFPYTYEFIMYLKKWCETKNWSKIVVLNKFDKDGNPLALIDMIEKNNTIPSAAFGSKSCSLRFKSETADKYFNNHPKAWETWGVSKKGSKMDSHTGSILRLVGINADEPERVIKWAPEHKWVQAFPLFDWDVGEKESAAVERVGLYYPGKSSCYCCPHMSGKDLIGLRDNYPPEFQRIKVLELNYQKNRSRTDGPKGLLRKDTIDSKIKSYEENGEKYDPFESQQCGNCR